MSTYNTTCSALLDEVIELYAMGAGPGYICGALMSVDYTSFGPVNPAYIEGICARLDAMYRDVLATPIDVVAGGAA